jgi:uncharacterized NAD(P)/FAD-binding protein YdhS
VADRLDVCETPVGTFASRGLYGRYLTEILTDAVSQARGAARLTLVPEAVVDLKPEGAGFLLTLEGGRTHAVAGAVLAIGNLSAESPGRGTSRRPVARTLPPAFGDAPLVIRAGLTMVDASIFTLNKGFTGPIIATQRRGLIPHEYDIACPWPSRIEPGDAAKGWCTGCGWCGPRSRPPGARESAGACGRLCGRSPRPCGNLSPAEQARFLRHLRPWWDVHRHRLAPAAATAIAAMRNGRRLVVLAGRIEALVEEEDRIELTFRPRGGGTMARIRAQRIIDATGLAPVGEVRDSFLRRILMRGLVRYDSHRLGLDVTDALQAIGQDGVPARRLWALGPIVRGVFWECTAVPDIADQARRLAGSIAAGL